MTEKEIARLHPRMHTKAHEYAWKKTSEIYDRHDGRLSLEQLKLYNIILQAWFAGRGIEMDINTEITEEQALSSSKYYHF